MSELTPKQVLLDAAEIVEQKWTRSTYWNATTDCYCAVGSLMKASGAIFEIIWTPSPAEEQDGELPDYDIKWPGIDYEGDEPVQEEQYSEHAQAYLAAQKAAVAELDPEKDRGVCSLISWNDQVASGPAEVAALFRAAAAKLDD